MCRRLASGGVTAPVSDDNYFPYTSPIYMLYPGVYTVSAADPGDYIEADPVIFKAARDEYSSVPTRFGM